MADPGPADVFVAKLSAMGDSLLWATYLGGQGEEKAFGIALDSAGQPVLVGRTEGGEPHLLLGHETRVPGLEFSPDGSFLASSGQDGTVRVWPVPDLSKPPLTALPRAELLAKRYEVAMARNGLSRQLSALRRDLFRVPPKPGDQLSLF